MRRLDKLEQELDDAIESREILYEQLVEARLKLHCLQKQAKLCVISCDGTSDDDNEPATLVARTVDRLTAEVERMRPVVEIVGQMVDHPEPDEWVAPHRGLATAYAAFRAAAPKTKQPEPCVDDDQRWSFVVECTGEDGGQLVSSTCTGKVPESFLALREVALSLGEAEYCPCTKHVDADTGKRTTDDPKQPEADGEEKCPTGTAELSWVCIPGTDDWFCILGDKVIAQASPPHVQTCGACGHKPKSEWVLVLYEQDGTVAESMKETPDLEYVKYAVGLFAEEEYGIRN